MSGRTNPLREQRVVVGMAGDVGVAYGVRLLEVLRRMAVESHLVLTDAAAKALGPGADDVRRLADRVYDEANQAARISSGSFLTTGMVVAPCSARSLAAIVMGVATNLVYRAADVTLKERRPLVLGIPPSSWSEIDRENIARAAAIPGLAVERLEGPSEEVVAALLAHLGIGSNPSAG